MRLHPDKKYKLGHEKEQKGSNITGSCRRHLCPFDHSDDAINQCVGCFWFGKDS